MNRKEKLLQEALNGKLIDGNTTAIGIMDYKTLNNTIDDLIDAFPANFYHTFAVKANALVDVLKTLRAGGIGAEVASPGELQAALKAGYTAEEIIFDSPAKTMDDLHTCIKNNISVNIDNLQELSRIDALMKTYPNSKSVIGFRINAQVGTGQILAMSTATPTSKFGYAISDGDNRALLIKIYQERPWLTSIHTHSGSQGVALDLMVKGIRCITDLAHEINEAVGHNQVSRLDIGGGLPVNTASEEITPTFQEYSSLLSEHIPELFDGSFQVKTEFGRTIAAKNGVTITRVEYTKSSGGRHIAITHAGAQILTRTAFVPGSWPLRVSIFDAEGNIKNESNTETTLTDIAGPCCFAGDLICKEARLPKAEPNDYVMIHDNGGYYFTNHFDYNSLPRIAIYSATGEDDSIRLKLIRKAEGLEDVVGRL